MKLCVLHGPNLNMLGRREPSIYGSLRLIDIDCALQNLARELKVELIIEQSNMEGMLVSAIQESPDAGVEGILINPGAYGHTSIAIRDALLSVALPFVEVHISNTFAREEFRHRSLISDIASGIIIGLGPAGYLHALRALVHTLKIRKTGQSPLDDAFGKLSENDPAL